MKLFLVFLVWWFFNHSFSGFSVLMFLTLSRGWFLCLYTVAWLCACLYFVWKIDPSWPNLCPYPFFLNDCKVVFNQICFCNGCIWVLRLLWLSYNEKIMVASQSCIPPFTSPCPYLSESVYETRWLVSFLFEYVYVVWVKW